MNTALLVVDIQNDYFPGGTMELVGATEAGNQAKKVIETFRQKSLPIFHLQHIATHAGATFFLPNTQGAEIHQSVRPNDREMVFQKHYPNSFRETPLLDHLRQNEVTRLAIVGMMTHVCIDTTTRAAADLGFECLLASDACATRAQSFNGITVSAASVQAAFLASIDGWFAKVSPVRELCAVL
jgi:nicotinamidase-related amidase